nr:hypothetical protein [Streptomyces sp. S1D4-11]
MEHAPFPPDLIELQAEWQLTYAVLAAPHPVHTTALRRRLQTLSGTAAVSPVLIRPGTDAGGARGAAPPGPRRGVAAVNRRPEHLTAREEQILRCIRRWIEERGEGPSVRQLADDIGLSSTASVAYHLGNLEKRGALVRDGRGWRTCRLVR